jgi:hypothetical protein
MYSQDRPETHNPTPSDAEEIPMLQRRTIHPDSLKFMDMAKELLDSPPIQKAVQSEQQKPKDGK